MEQQTLHKQLEAERQKLKDVILKAVTEYTEKTGLGISKIEVELEKVSTMNGVSYYYKRVVFLTEI